MKPVKAESSEEMKGWRRHFLSWLLPLQLVGLFTVFVFCWCGRECPAGRHHAGVGGWRTTPVTEPQGAPKPGPVGPRAEAAASAEKTAEPAATANDGKSGKGVEGAKGGPAGLLCKCDVDTWLFLMVLVSGAVGGAVHALSSFVAYAGERKLTMSWFSWYVLRAPIGAGLALMIYASLRAGLMGSNPGELNHAGFIAIALLTGMFNAQAIEKLKKVAEAVFSPSPPRTDPIDSKAGAAGGTAPVLTDVQPRTAKAGTDLPIKLSGAGFDAETRLVVGGVTLKPVKWTADTLEAIIPTTLVKPCPLLPVWVTAGEGGVRSTARFGIKVS